MLNTICTNQRQLRFLLICSVTQHQLVLGYWSFEAAYQFLLQGTAWLLETGPVSYPKTSVTNYHSTLHNISEQQRPHLQHGKSLRSHTGSFFAVQRIKLLLTVAYMAMKIPATIFWGVTPCSLVGGHQHFTGAYCLKLQPANKCTMSLLNICTHLLSTHCHIQATVHKNISHGENLQLEGQMVYKPKSTLTANLWPWNNNACKIQKYQLTKQLLQIIQWHNLYRKCRYHSHVNLGIFQFRKTEGKIISYPSLARIPNTLLRSLFSCLSFSSLA